MSVIPLTVFFSLLLAGIFIVLFAHEQRRRRFASSESDSLLPLADEVPRVVGDHPQAERDLRPSLKLRPARFQDSGLRSLGEAGRARSERVQRPRSPMAASANDGGSRVSSSPP